MSVWSVPWAPHIAAVAAHPIIGPNAISTPFLNPKHQPARTFLFDLLVEPVKTALVHLSP